MHSVRLLVALLSTAFFSFAASSQPANAPQPPLQAPAPAQELPKGYVPGLGEFMGRIEVDHAKLWLAGEARNWELADYQLTELKEVLSDVQDFVPAYQHIPVAEMIDAIIVGTVSDLEKAIAARDFNAFSASFDKLTAGCNSCHEAANKAFIAIRRPAQSNFSNQDFSPRKK